MADTSKNGIVTMVRTFVADERPNTVAFSLGVSAKASCRSCLLEVRQGFLTTTVENGQGIEAMSLNLSDPRYSTVGRLVAELSSRRGYAVVTESSFAYDRPSDDLVVPGGLHELSTEKVVAFRHRTFSDAEIVKFIGSAIALHNPNYPGIGSVPKNEVALVAMKAASLALTARATEAAGRTMLGVDPQKLLNIVRQLDERYAAEVQRLKPVLPVPKTDESKIGHGDVVIGKLYRDSLRSGGREPHRHVVPQTPPKLYDFIEEDIGDTTVRLRWSVPRDTNFAHFEVWRSTSPGVERNLAGRIVSPTSPQLAVSTQYSDINEARQIVGVPWGGASPVYDGMYFGTWSENAFSGTSYIDGHSYTAGGQSGVLLHEPLEPETDYYYRIFAMDQNRQVSASEERRVRTRAMRARFSRLAGGALDVSSISPQEGPLAGGTALTVVGTNLANAKLRVNGKEAVTVSNSGTVLVVTTPGFQNTQLVGMRVDLVLVSPNGLKDIAQGGFRYT